MKVAVYNKNGEKTKDLTLSKCFDVKVSPEAVTLYFNYLRSSRRAAIANTKDRGAVSGGGKKPWRQKGTGNARVGSNRSPLWVGGGVTFGPHSDRNFTKRINTKEKKRVILSIIGDFFREKKAVVVENLNFDKPKTSEASKLLESLKVSGKISTVVSEADKNALISMRNIGGVDPMDAKNLNMIAIFGADQLVVSVEALSKIEDLFVNKKETSVKEKAISKKTVTVPAEGVNSEKEKENE